MVKKYPLSQSVTTVKQLALGVKKNQPKSAFSASQSVSSASQKNEQVEWISVQSQSQFLEKSA
jgi:hypothetical protein